VSGVLHADVNVVHDVHTSVFACGGVRIKSFRWCSERINPKPTPPHPISQCIGCSTEPQDHQRRVPGKHFPCHPSPSDRTASQPPSSHLHSYRRRSHGALRYGTPAPTNIISFRCESICFVSLPPASLGHRPVAHERAARWVCASRSQRLCRCKSGLQHKSASAAMPCRARSRPRFPAR
jgi:hypothetical protein